MSVFHFRWKAAQSYGHARSAREPRREYEALMRLGHEFKARVTKAMARLTGVRQEAVRPEAEREEPARREAERQEAVRREAERQEAYRDSRE